MQSSLRWDPCIEHQGEEAKKFLLDYFADNSRKILFLAGAGFDPRSTAFSTLIAQVKSPIKALLIQESRPNPINTLVQRAEKNMQHLVTTFSDHTIMNFKIFGADNAVVGGRNAVASLNQQKFDNITDVVIDISALSIGTSFPIIRYLVERIEDKKGPPNLHILVAHDPKVDEAVQSITCEAPGYVHGFRGRSGLDASASAARLWLPQLTRNRKAALLRLYDFVKPHDTCPILPFPASNPRLGDELAEHYLSELENAWSVDTRNIVYAAENDPLDLYRTILRLDDLRQPVFEECGGSLLVLSPAGKVMALGALMAALERNLPVAYLEAIGYNLDASVPEASSEPHLVHVWLEGDVYPQPRPKLLREGI